MTRSEIFRNNYKYQASESKRLGTIEYKKNHHRGISPLANRKVNSELMRKSLEEYKENIGKEPGE